MKNVKKVQDGNKMFKPSGHEFNKNLTNKQMGMTDHHPGFPSNLIPKPVGGRSSGKMKGSY